MLLMGLLVILSAICILALVGGFMWLMISSSDSTRREDGEIGREIMGEQSGGDWQSPIGQKTAFKGKAIMVERQSTISFTELKEQIKSGHWRDVLPFLLAVGGFLGLLFFGSLALLVALDDKLIGGLIAAVGIVSVFRVLIRMVKA